MTEVSASPILYPSTWDKETGEVFCYLQVPDADGEVAEVYDVGPLPSLHVEVAVDVYGNIVGLSVAGVPQRVRLPEPEPELPADAAAASEQGVSELEDAPVEVDA